MGTKQADIQNVRDRSVNPAPGMYAVVGTGLKPVRTTANQNVVQLINPGGIAADSPAMGRGAPAWASIPMATP